MHILATELESIVEYLFPPVTIDVSWNNALVIDKIIVATSVRNQGIGTEVMKYICVYANNNKVSVILTPDGTFGGDVIRLREFYKRFGFVERDNRSLIRLPRG